MNSRGTVCFTLALAACLAGTARAAGPASVQESTLQKVELLRLAEELGLDESASLALLAEFSRYHAEHQGLYAKRATLAAEVAGATRATDTQFILDALMDLDDQVLDLQLDTFERMARGLTPYQQARLYLFLIPGAEQAHVALPVAAPVAALETAAAVTAPAVPAAPAESSIPAAPVVVEPVGDEAEIRALVQALKQGLEALDIDAVMETFSDQFSHADVGGKEEARYLLETGMDMGYADGGEIFTDDMEIKVEGDTATIYPVELSSAAGAVTLELVLGKDEDGKWRVHTLNADGL